MRGFIDFTRKWTLAEFFRLVVIWVGGEMPLELAGTGPQCLGGWWFPNRCKSLVINGTTGRKRKKRCSFGSQNCRWVERRTQPVGAFLYRRKENGGAHCKV